MGRYFRTTGKSIDQTEPEIRTQAVQVFIIGSKSIGQYGGFETFVDKLTEYHQKNQGIQYHIACKANGTGCMDETKLHGIVYLGKKDGSSVMEFLYRNIHVFKLKVPDIGSAVAIWYDVAAMQYSIRYCKDHKIVNPVFYVLASRIGPFIGHFKRQIVKLGGKLYLNPDGNEWKRAKWSVPIKWYWKKSEKWMVKHSDLIVCDSLNVEKYIKNEYIKFTPRTVYIAYGADMVKSRLSNSDFKYRKWLESRRLKPGEYYLVVGRFVPENNFETIIREFMKSCSEHKLVIITDKNQKLFGQLERKLQFQADERIIFAGTVYDKELLKKIRENALGYFHGHEVGGTNPSLLEALESTEVNLLLDVRFNREVGEDAVLYWKKEPGNLKLLIEAVEKMSVGERHAFGEKAVERIKKAYRWQFIADQYEELWSESRKSCSGQ